MKSKEEYNKELEEREYERNLRIDRRNQGIELLKKNQLKKESSIRKRLGSEAVRADKKGYINDKPPVVSSEDREKRRS